MNRLLAFCVLGILVINLKAIFRANSFSPAGASFHESGLPPAPVSMMMKS